MFAVLRLHRTFIAVWITVAVALCQHAVAQVVGEVVSTSTFGRVDVQRQGEPPRPAAGSIQVGDTYLTGDSGVTRLLFYGDVVANPKGDLPLVLQHVHLAESSAAVVVAYNTGGAGGAYARFALKRGTAFAAFGPEEKAHLEFETSTAIVIATGTAFIVSCTDDSTEVITLSGSVTVRSLVMQEKERVTVPAGKMTTVAQGARRLELSNAPEARLRAGIDGLELIGGGAAESLALADGVRMGRDVRPAERYQVTGRRPPEILDPCPLATAPTCIPPEPLGGLGDLDIEF